MTRPADIPQWAWDEAENVASSLFGNYGSSEDLPPIARALLAAYERGRGEQREAVFAEIKKCPWLEVDHEIGPIGCELEHECVCEPIARTFPEPA